MIKKRDIRRAVHVTCVAGGGSGSDGAVPARVTLRVQHRRRRLLFPVTASRQVGVFVFQQQPRPSRFPASVTALVDLERLYKVSREAGEGAATVKVCVEHLGGEKRVARIGLADFLGQVLCSGRPEWCFLTVYGDKVTFLPANLPIPKDVPEWPFDGCGKGAHHQGQEAEGHKNDGPVPNGRVQTKDGELQKESEETTASEHRHDKDLCNDNKRECATDKDGCEDVQGEESEDEQVKCETEAESLPEDEKKENSVPDEAFKTNYDEETEDGTEESLPEEEKEQSVQAEESKTDSDERTVPGTAENLTEEEEKEESANAGVSYSFLSGMGAARRLAHRALLVVAVVVWVMIILDAFLPPFDEDEGPWGSGGLKVELLELFDLVGGHPEGGGREE